MKWKCLLFVVLLVPLVMAQQNALVVKASYSTATSSAWYPVSGYTSHTLTWSQTGSTSVTGCAVQVDSSPIASGSGTAGGIIASQSATTNGTASTTNVTASFARVTVTGCATGTILVTYSAVNAAVAKSVSPPGGHVFVTSAGADVCAAINAAVLNGGPRNTVDASPINTGANCLTDPFANMTASGLTLTLPCSQVTTNVPWIMPTYTALVGCGRVASIAASATFLSNFPAYQGTGTATLCFLTSQGGTNGTHDEVYSGVMNAGATQCVGDGGTSGTANFNAANGGGSANGTCGPTTIAQQFVAGTLCGYMLYISPSGQASGTCNTGGTTTCNVPENSIAIGRVRAVVAVGAGTSALYLERNVLGPVTQPSANTGYQYQFVMPVIQTGTELNSTPCNGTPANCISNGQQLSHFIINCNDGANPGDLHNGYDNINGQEGVYNTDLGIQNCRYIFFDKETTGAQNSGPETDLVFGGNENVTTSQLKHWQTGYTRGYYGASLTGLATETLGDAQYANAINGGTTVFDTIHTESATAGIELGDTTVWPWAAGGTGCLNTQIRSISGNSAVTETVHYLNVATTVDCEVMDVVAAGATNAIVDDRAGTLTYAAAAIIPPRYSGLCFSAAGTCTTQSGGVAQIAAAATTVTVTTTAISPRSVVHLGLMTTNQGGLTCTAPANIATLPTPYVSSITGGTSFVITIGTAPTTNPACVTWNLQ